MDARSSWHDVTRIVELTPRGRGALAVVLVAGPDATRQVERSFRPASGRLLGEQGVDCIAVGHWGGPDGEELVVCRRANDQVEIHCHGGLAAVGAVVERLVQGGCQPTSWQDWLRQAADDPLRAAAHVALADAPTARTAMTLLDQYHGALAAASRAALDAVSAAGWSAAEAVLDDLLARKEFGLHLTQPWRVVLAGRPNVGKSSLINALVGHQRAIVSELPGTTRDVVTATTAVDGWPIHLSDTAGLRDAGSVVEAAGVERAGTALAGADLVLWVVDASDPSGTSPDNELLRRLPATARLLRILNKVDLLSQPPADAGNDVLTSAVTGQGIETLVNAIGRALVPESPAAGAAVPFTREQITSFDEARAAVARRDATAAAATLQSLLAQ